MSEKFVSLDRRFVGQMGYSDKPMNQPPAEERPSVLPLSLSEGCSHRACTFCTMYDRKEPFSTKTPDEFRAHTDAAVEYLEHNPQELQSVSRIFLGAGNALAADTGTLLDASQYALQRLQRAKGGEIPRRLAVYGNTRDILEKGHRGMQLLFCGGTCFTGCSKDRLGDRRGVDVVYWGVESGDSAVLKKAGKGYDNDDLYEAARILNDTGVRSSVMIMPGLGGEAYSDDHVQNTAEFLNYLMPQWITFMGLKIFPGTPYEKWMENEERRGSNRRLTDIEVAMQTARIIDKLHIRTTVGIHGSDVHAYNPNPVTIGSREIFGRSDAKAVAEELRRKVLIADIASARSKKKTRPWSRFLRKQ